MGGVGGMGGDIRGGAGGNHVHLGSPRGEGGSVVGGEGGREEGREGGEVLWKWYTGTTFKQC